MYIYIYTDNDEIIIDVATLFSIRFPCKAINILCDIRIIEIVHALFLSYIRRFNAAIKIRAIPVFIILRVVKSRFKRKN